MEPVHKGKREKVKSTQMLFVGLDWIYLLIALQSTLTLMENYYRQTVETMNSTAEQFHTKTFLQ